MAWVWTPVCYVLIHWVTTGSSHLKPFRSRLQNGASVWPCDSLCNVLLAGSSRMWKPTRLVPAHPKKVLPRSHHMVPEDMVAVCLPSKSLLPLKPWQDQNCPMPQQMPDRMDTRQSSSYLRLQCFPQIHAHLKPQNMTLFGILRDV